MFVPTHSVEYPDYLRITLQATFVTDIKISVTQTIYFTSPVGTFDELEATQYCIDLEKTVISSQQHLKEDE